MAAIHSFRLKELILHTEKRLASGSVNAGRKTSSPLRLKAFSVLSSLLSRNAWNPISFRLLHAPIREGEAAA